MRRFITHDEAAILLPFQIRENGFLDPGTESGFFLSFADAFRWLMQCRPKAAATILIPDFYCPETVNLYAQYGKVVFYNIRDDLAVDVDAYSEAIRKYAPDVIVNYGFFGFPSGNKKIRSLLASLPETLVIEDFAHRILSKDEVAFVDRNHVYIDSIRKQTSLLGSHLISQQTETNCGARERINMYKLRCMALRAIRMSAIVAAKTFNSEFFYKKSEKYFERLDGVIGTNGKATLGGKLTGMIWHRIDFKKVVKHKRDLIHIYTSGLSGLHNEYFSIPPILDENITYFPCLVSPVVRDKLLEYLEEKNIWMGPLWDPPDHSRFELNIHLLERLVVLPLTWRTSPDDAERICKAISDFFSQSD